MPAGAAAGPACLAQARHYSTDNKGGGAAQAARVATRLPARAAGRGRVDCTACSPWETYTAALSSRASAVLAATAPARLCGLEIQVLQRFVILQDHANLPVKRRNNSVRNKGHEA